MHISNIFTPLPSIFPLPYSPISSFSFQGLDETAFREQYGAQCPEMLLKLTFSCCDFDPLMRPHFGAIRDALHLFISAMRSSHCSSCDLDRTLCAIAEEDDDGNGAVFTCRDLRETKRDDRVDNENIRLPGHMLDPRAHRMHLSPSDSHNREIVCQSRAATHSEGATATSRKAIYSPSVCDNGHDLFLSSYATVDTVQSPSARPPTSMTSLSSGIAHSRQVSSHDGDIISPFPSPHAHQTAAPDIVRVGGTAGNVAASRRLPLVRSVAQELDTPIVTLALSPPSCAPVSSQSIAHPTAAWSQNISTLNYPEMPVDPRGSKITSV